MKKYRIYKDLHRNKFYVKSRYWFFFWEKELRHNSFGFYTRYFETYEEAREFVLNRIRDEKSMNKPDILVDSL